MLAHKNSFGFIYYSIKEKVMPRRSGAFDLLKIVQPFLDVCLRPTNLLGDLLSDCGSIEEEIATLGAGLPRDDKLT